MGLLLFVSSLIWGQTGLSVISSYMGFMNAPPLGLYRTTEGRILLLYPRGYVDFSAELETDRQTLQSLWYSDSQKWPLIKQGQLLEDQFFLIDQENRLYRFERYSGDWQEITIPVEHFQRLYFLQPDKIALFYQNNWQFFLLTDNWTALFGPSLSPLTMVLGEVNNSYIVDPLQGVCFSPQEEKIPLNPPPNSSANKGMISSGTLWLWSSSERWEYDLQGTLISKDSTAEGMLNHLLPLENGLIRYNLPSGSLFRGDEPYNYTENDWVSFLKKEIPPLLETVEREQLAWLLDYLNKTFQSHPLDRELGLLKKDVELTLQGNRVIFE